MRKILLTLMVAATSIWTTGAIAHNHDTTTDKIHTIGDIHISKAYVKPTNTIQRPSVAYLTLKNTGKTDDTLLSVTTDVTKTAQIHETKIDTKGVMSMNHLTQGLTIPAGKTVELNPRGLHLMLLGLTKVLKEKDTVSVALTFAKAGTKTIILPIQDIHIEQCPKDCQHCKEHKDCKDCKHCKDKAVTPQQCKH